MNKSELIEQLEMQDDDGNSILAVFPNHHSVNDYVITYSLKFDIVAYPLVDKIYRRDILTDLNSNL